MIFQDLSVWEIAAIVGAFVASGLVRGFNGGAGANFITAPVVALSQHRRRQPDRTGRGRFQPRQKRGKGLQMSLGYDDQQQTLGIAQQVAYADLALPLNGPTVAQRQQSGQTAPSRAILGIGDDVRRAVVESQTGAGQQAKILCPRLDHVRQGRIVHQVFDETCLSRPATITDFLRRRQSLYA